MDFLSDLATVWETASSLFSSTHREDVKKGQKYISQEKWALAIDSFGAVDASDSDFDQVIAYSGRGFCFEILKRYDEAIIEYDKILEIDPSFFSFDKDFISEQKTHARKRREFCLVWSLQSTNSKTFINGLDALEEEDYATAFNYFSKVNEYDKPLLRVMAHYYKGVCRFIQNEEDKALINFKRAIDFTTPYNPKYNAEIREYQSRAQYMVDILGY